MITLEKYKKYKEDKKEKKKSEKKGQNKKKILDVNDKKLQFVLTGKIKLELQKSYSGRIAHQDKKQSNLKPKYIKKEKLPTGEKKLFFEIRNERVRSCIICGKNIKEAKTRCFAHILPKGQRPKYRLHKNNIVLVCSIDCHHKVDSMIVGKKKLVEDQLLSGIIPNIKGLI